MRLFVVGIAGALTAGSLMSSPAMAKVCGHDVHGAPTIGVTELSPGHSIIHYFSPATLIMEYPGDPRHRAFGECRGQGVVIDGVENWSGACFWKDAEGDVFVAYWSSKPGDKGPEVRDAMHGTAELGFGSTRKFAALAGHRPTWTGLANGGSYFCDE